MTRGRISPAELLTPPLSHLLHGLLVDAQRHPLGSYESGGERRESQSDERSAQSPPTQNRRCGNHVRCRELVDMDENLVPLPEPCYTTVGVEPNDPGGYIRHVILLLSTHSWGCQADIRARRSNPSPMAGVRLHVKPPILSLVFQPRRRDDSPLVSQQRCC